MSEPFLSRGACAVIGTLSGVSAVLCMGWFSRLLGRFHDGLADVLTW